MATATALIVRPSPLIRVSPRSDCTTVGELCEVFMRSKRLLQSTGEIVSYRVDRYTTTCSTLRDFFGEYRDIETLRAADFSALRASFPSTWGPAYLGDKIQNVRTIFHYAFEADLIERPIRFGPDFKRPKQLLYRRARWLRGPRMFEADEIRLMLTTLHDRLRAPSNPWGLRAMILLGVNCGFGNADCGRLTFSALDMQNGWVNYPRQKTETDRRCPLWPETIEAIRRHLIDRPNPKSPALADRVFLTRRGSPWADGGPSPALTSRLRWLMRRAGIQHTWRGFYGLRRSFRTIADETNEQPAINLIMGHLPSANDMAAVYRQRISDDRLVAVAEHVRAWLFPGGSLEWYDPNHEKAARQLRAEWDALPRLAASDIVAAIERLGITNRELARAVRA